MKIAVVGIFLFISLVITLIFQWREANHVNRMLFVLNMLLVFLCFNVLNMTLRAAVNEVPTEQNTVIYLPDGNSKQFVTKQERVQDFMSISHLDKQTAEEIVK